MTQTNKEAWQKMRQRQIIYATFEKEIIDLHERMLLTLELLDQVARQYQQADIDCAGSQPLLARDSKDIYQICIELIDPTFPTVARGSSEDHDEYWERELKKWEEIMYIRWGWDRELARCYSRSQRDDAA